MPSRTVKVHLDLQELRTLRDLAHYYERSMGRFRILVRATSGADVRRRFRFVAQESAVLHAFAEATLREMAEKELVAMPVEMEPRALIAFWGRLLASLTARRSRRRLSAEEIERREVLSDKLAGAAARVARRDPAALESALATRRPVEAAWMRRRLEQRESDAS